LLLLVSMRSPQFQIQFTLLACRCPELYKEM
jgi:hypothetical protein